MPRRHPLNVMKKIPYGNIRVLAPDGTPMFCCGPKKRDWYVARGLAVAEGNTLRLLFVPNGLGHAGDEFYLTEKGNHCVVCGSTKTPTKHHVVPYCYRRYLPDEIKKWNHHDVVVMCIPCHSEYEGHADRRKVEFGVMYNSPISGSGTLIDYDLDYVQKSVITICKYGQQLPAYRLEELYASIEEYLGFDPSFSDMVNLLDRHSIDMAGYVSHGQKIVEQLTDYQAFVDGWRLHFLETMDPQFLPSGWDATRSVHREMYENRSATGS